MSAESERIERQALSALHAVVDAPLAEALAVELHEIAGGVASVAGALPAAAIVLNRALGMDSALLLDDGGVESVTALYAERDIERWFLQIPATEMNAHLEARLEAAGLMRARAWQKFVRGRDDPLPEPAAAIDTRAINASAGEAFARIVCHGFDLGEAAIPWLARLPEAPGWRAFLSFEAGRPVGAGALFIDAEVAWTDFGATDPASRRRGVQLASLATRVRAALAAGCQRIYTCTGEAVPGEPQHSYANILRCGFSESSLRENWQRAAKC